MSLFNSIKRLASAISDVAEESIEIGVSTVELGASSLHKVNEGISYVKTELDDFTYREIKLEDL